MKIYISGFSKIIISCFVVFLFLTIGTNTVYAASIGVSPTGINNRYLIPGAHIEQEFIISRGNPDKDVAATIEVDAEYIENWITIEPSTEILLPKGQQRVPFKVIVDVPEDVGHGKYDGYVRVKTVQETLGQITIQPAIRLDLNFIVSGEMVEKFEVHNPEIPIFYSGDPLILRLEVTNLGNTAASLDEIKINILDVEGNFIEYLETTETPSVEAFSTETIDVIFDKLDLEPGTYLADISVFHNLEKLLEDRLIFQVIESGKEPEEVVDIDELPETGEEERTLMQKISDALSNALMKAKDFIIEMPAYAKTLAGLVLIILAFIIFFILFRKSRKEKEEAASERAF